MSNADEGDKRRPEGVSMKLVAILGASLATVLGILSTVLVLLVKSFVTQMDVQHRDNISQRDTHHSDFMQSQQETRQVMRELTKADQELSETFRQAYLDARQSRSGRAAFKAGKSTDKPTITEGAPK